MSDRLPLTEVGGDEALVRVIYQLILSDYQLHPTAYDEPAWALFSLSNDWNTSGFPLIGEQVNLAALWVANGGTVATWLRAHIIFRAGRAGRLSAVQRRRI